MKPKTLEDLLAQVEKTENGCWEWTGYKSRHGYGLKWWNGKRWLAPRLLFYLMGFRLTKADFVCHKCDNPPCCNPDHLFLGDTRSNTRDKVNKGRQAKGEAVGTSKLNKTQVASIRQRYYTGGVTQEVLAKEYGVSQVRVGSIVRNVGWATVGESKKSFRHRSSKLTQEIADSIRKDHSEGVLNTVSLAKKYGVHKSNISLIIRNKTWKPKNAEHCIHTETPGSAASDGGME